MSLLGKNGATFEQSRDHKGHGSLGRLRRSRGMKLKACSVMQPALKALKGASKTYTPDLVL